MQIQIEKLLHTLGSSSSLEYVAYDEKKTCVKSACFTDDMYCTCKRKTSSELVTYIFLMVKVTCVSTCCCISFLQVVIDYYSYFWWNSTEQVFVCRLF